MYKKHNILMKQHIWLLGHEVTPSSANAEREAKTDFNRYHYLQIKINNT